ncbi:hypothetical protein N798_03815 [Knoellia flava TL1]|uniref:Tyr recombinase domain-containing protein n=3 Tax=Knoellia flava TaxID=913969 RepID=A0A8H9KRW2_9MICO|nr:hypothetical protein N798_03815 [Knoellia flava TL1]GGB90090.1 hypothetical protein GCM10011314_32440 [Knoellia flava]
MWADCGLVFTTRLGDPVDPRNFHRDFKLRAAKAGVPIVPIHSTRRTCASLLVALDVHPRVAMAVLRHSRIALTMGVYSQVSTQSTRDALRQLGATSQLANSSSLHKRSHPFAKRPQLLNEPRISIAGELKDGFGTPQGGLRTFVEDLVILLLTSAQLVSRAPKCEHVMS